MKVEYPCKDCSDRQLGCHDKCEEYQKAKKLHEEQRSKWHEEVEIRAGVFYHKKTPKTRRRQP